VATAAEEAWAARSALLPPDAGLADNLVARWDTAVHIAVHVGPYPALIRNAATFLVEEAVVVARRLHGLYKRTQAEATMRRAATEKLSEEETARATGDLVRYSGDGGLSLVQETTELLVRSAVCVAVESLSDGIGTFLLPGVGTYIVELVGGLLVWIL